MSAPAQRGRAWTSVCMLASAFVLAIVLASQPASGHRAGFAHGVEQVPGHHRRRLLQDNGTAAELTCSQRAQLLPPTAADYAQLNATSQAVIAAVAGVNGTNTTASPTMAQCAAHFCALAELYILGMPNKQRPVPIWEYMNVSIPCEPSYQDYMLNVTGEELFNASVTASGLCAGSSTQPTSPEDLEAFLCGGLLKYADLAPPPPAEIPRQLLPRPSPPPPPPSPPAPRIILSGEPGMGAGDKLLQLRYLVPLWGGLLSVAGLALAGAL